ncbi:MAG: tripartite tricarboxylate transporter permease [Trueperaceae bacterium]|nr:tripartite tricarboxylate transporter permease [Trueperaceae bacterium]
MDLLANLGGGFAAILNLHTMLLMLFGVTAGLLVGALPGLTVTMSVAILVPLTFDFEPIRALSMLLSVYVGAVTGGAVSAILVNTPGTPASVATTFDGYPMAQQGKAARALGVALMVSIFGSLLSIVVLITLSPTIARAALRFSAPEYFAIAFFGLTMVVGIAGSDLIKGVMSAILGLYVGFIGLDPMMGMPRFTFGNVNLLGGFSFVPVLIGLFAISEALLQSTKLHEKAELTKVSGRILPPLRDFVRHRWLILKSAAIGTSVGALPGAGADIASLVSYNEAKRSSRHPERFGKGAEEGVVASETANNAIVGAALIPLLTLAIPGDAVTAVLLGAMRMHELRPGPLLFQHNEQEVFAMYAALLMSVLLLRVVGTIILPLFAHVMNVPRRYLVSGILLFSFVGSYAIGTSVFDMATALGFGVLGFIMLRFGFPVAPMVLALILGPLAEDRLRQALVMSQGDWSIFVTRPISAIVLAVAFASLFFAYRQQRQITRLTNPSDES